MNKNEFNEFDKFDSLKNPNIDRNEINGILDGYDSDRYEEVIISLADLKEGDKVKGSDGKWYDIEILPVIIPNKMFKITFIGEKIVKRDKNSSSCNNGNNNLIPTYGSIKCSGDHLWTIFDPNTGVPLTMKSEDIFEHSSVILNNHSVGDKNGPKFYSIEEIDPLPSRCISLKGSKDMLFEILLDNEDVANDSIYNKVCNVEDDKKFIDDTLFEVERK